MSKLRGSELRRIWYILGYLYNSLSAALWYKVFVLEVWNFTQCMNIYWKCATSKFLFDRLTNVKITGVWTETNLRYFGIFIQQFVRDTVVWGLCLRVLKLRTVKECILQMCNVEVSVHSTIHCRNYGGLNLDEFILIFWGICTGVWA